MHSTPLRDSPIVSAQTSISSLREGWLHLISNKRQHKKCKKLLLVKIQYNQPSPCLETRTIITAITPVRTLQNDTVAALASQPQQKLSLTNAPAPTFVARGGALGIAMMTNTDALVAAALNKIETEAALVIAVVTNNDMLTMRRNLTVPRVPTATIRAEAAPMIQAEAVPTSRVETVRILFFRQRRRCRWYLPHKQGKR